MKVSNLDIFCLVIYCGETVVASFVKQQLKFLLILSPERPSVFRKQSGERHRGYQSAANYIQFVSTRQCVKM